MIPTGVYKPDDGIYHKPPLLVDSVSDWLTSDGLFSVQSGWGMLSTRVRPWLYDDSEGYKRIRRLLLDLARGPSEISKGLQDKHRFGSAQNHCNNCELCTVCKMGFDNINNEFDSNRLDPYQVGITILSAYTNYPLRIFSQFNEKWESVSLSDCIQACIFESRLFSNKENSEKDFMDMILQFLVFIRDHDDSNEDHKLLSNKILSFCSAARISPCPVIDSPWPIDRVLRNYYGTKGRLFQISLKDIHKASNFLKLSQNLKWGWSIVVTVCFEKAVDKAYSETQKVFGGNAWLMSRTPGRALFFEQSGLIDLDLEKKFCEVFYEIFLETLLNACDGADSEEESRNISFHINKGDKDGSIRGLINKLVYVTCSGVSCPIFDLSEQAHKSSNSSNDTNWGQSEFVPVWAESLKYTAARGIRRFRLIQSLWQDLLSLRGNQTFQTVRPQKSSDEQKTFVYLDCIQLGDLLWNESNWVQSFGKARIIAPIIEGILSAFVSLSDTLYPEFKSEDMNFGPQALGGDELHIIVPGNAQKVQRELEHLGQKLWKHLEKYGLVKFDNWSRPNKKSRGRLYFKGGPVKEDKKSKKNQESKTRPRCPKTMWWVGIISDTDGHDFDELVESFLSTIKETKDFKRERWDQSNNLFQEM